MPQGAPILLDTTVYIDQLKGDLPPPIIELIATRPVQHGAPALSELVLLSATLTRWIRARQRI